MGKAPHHRVCVSWCIVGYPGLTFSASVAEIIDAGQAVSLVGLRCSAVKDLCWPIIPWTAREKVGGPAQNLGLAGGNPAARTNSPYEDATPAA